MRLDTEERVYEENYGYRAGRNRLERWYEQGYQLNDVNGKRLAGKVLRHDT
jgi:hypothetical protein